MTEEWRDIPGYEGLYQVSNLGRVRSLDREIRQENRGGPCVHRYSGRMLKPRISNCGYCRVCLCRRGKEIWSSIHRLVIENFVGPCPEGHECNHIDGDKTNNRIDNLEWVTRSENHRHAVKSGLCPSAPNAKLSPEIAGMVRKIWALGEYTQGQIGLMFGVDRTTINDITRGKTWGGT